MIALSRLLRLLDPVLSVIEIFIAIMLFCRRLPKRGRFWQRVGLVALLSAVATATAIGIGYFAFPQLTRNNALVAQIAVWSGVLVYATFAVVWCYEVSLWTSLFCCTAGYTVQNIASALAATSRVLAAEAGSFPARAAHWVRRSLRRALRASRCRRSSYDPSFFSVLDRRSWTPWRLMPCASAIS